MVTARGTRDAAGTWHPDDPADYPPLDCHGIWPWSVLDQNSRAWRERRTHWDRCYFGYDLSAGQVDANQDARGRREAAGFMPHWSPQWWHADAVAALRSWPDESFDYALTSPPYWTRERYSNDSRDLSTTPWKRFLEAHAAVIAETVRVLARDRFCTWVISDVRDHRGHLRGLPARTVDSFEAAGARLVNEQVLFERAGLRAKTTRPPWEACRTTTRRHQLVLTFVKGDRKKATLEVRRADR